MGGSASGDELGYTRSDAVRVTDRLEDLQHDAEVLAEQYNDWSALSGAGRV